MENSSYIISHACVLDIGDSEFSRELIDVQHIDWTFDKCLHKQTGY